MEFLFPPLVRPEPQLHFLPIGLSVCHLIEPPFLGVCETFSFSVLVIRYNDLAGSKPLIAFHRLPLGPKLLLLRLTQ